MPAEPLPPPGSSLGRPYDRTEALDDLRALGRQLSHQVSTGTGAGATELDATLSVMRAVHDRITAELGHRPAPAPAPRTAWDRAHARKPPARRIAGQAVLVHPDGDRFVLLDMAHRPCRRLPGGHAAPDEPPHRAARRLVGAQLGLSLPITGTDLALVDYAAADPAKDAREGYNFVFVRQLTRNQADLARPLQDAGPDLRGFDWVTPKDLSSVCEGYHVRRVTKALSWFTDGVSAPLLAAGVPAE
ncbi:NUDIX domain-containing protein [Kitasatospora sp. NPDC052896]|uniref:NUDIX domain-containing protein n=1 Tax=Kitasatospora sp. NPDC052896 TaxID=3364061 RepID=UPI0037C73C16